MVEAISLVLAQATGAGLQDKWHVENKTNGNVKFTGILSLLEGSFFPEYIYIYYIILYVYIYIKRERERERERGVLLPRHLSKARDSHPNLVPLSSDPCSHWNWTVLRAFLALDSEFLGWNL